MALQPGTEAPDFTLKTKQGDDLVDCTLSELRGKKNVVLLFFPAAFTGVCEKEMCDVSAGIKAYNDLDADVCGISPDSPFAQEAWAKQAGIDVWLLSDYQKEVAKAYDVLMPDLIGLGPGSKRAVFVIDKNGMIAHSEETPTPLELPDFDKVKAALKAL